MTSLTGAGGGAEGVLLDGARKAFHLIRGLICARHTCLDDTQTRNPSKLMKTHSRLPQLNLAATENGGGGEGPGHNCDITASPGVEGMRVRDEVRPAGRQRDIHFLPGQSHFQHGYAFAPSQTPAESSMHCEC